VNARAYFRRLPHPLFRFIIHTSICLSLLSIYLSVFLELFNQSLGRYWRFFWNMACLLEGYPVGDSEHNVPASCCCHMRHITQSLRFTCHVVWHHFSRSSPLFSDGTHKIRVSQPLPVLFSFWFFLAGVSIHAAVCRQCLTLSSFNFLTYEYFGIMGSWRWN
jgi:hypothetical protein